MQGRVEQPLARGMFHQHAAVHHQHALRDLPHDGKIVRDEEHGETQLLLQRVQQVDDLRLHRDVECGDRLVADQQLGLHHQGAGDADALALAAREFLHGAAHVGGGEADALQHRRDAPRTVCFGDVGPECGKRLLDDLADLHAWIEAGDRILEHHLDLAAQRLPALLVELGEIATLEDRRTAGDGLQAEQRPREARFAAAGFPDQAERLTGMQVEVDAIHDIAPVARAPGQQSRLRIADREATDDQQRRGHARIFARATKNPPCGGCFLRAAKPVIPAGCATSRRFSRAPACAA